MSETPNAAQIEYWNDTAGPIWVELQEQLDRQTAPLGHAAQRALAPQPGERILDIGCGCGQSAWELAARVGPTGAVTGVDLSAAMLEVARTRPAPAGAARPEFRQADAQTDELGAGAFDAAFSRFGVMFFSDPAAAFANIAMALKPGGRLAFVCWRTLAENPLLRAPAEAAAPWLPPLPPFDPTAPGPFAFSDPERVRGVLGRAGFSEILIDPFDTRVGGGDVEAAVALALKIGPLGTALRANPDRRQQVVHAVRDAVAAYSTPDGVLMPAAVWIVTART